MPDKFPLFHYYPLSPNISISIIHSLSLFSLQYVILLIELGSIEDKDNFKTPLMHIIHSTMMWNLWRTIDLYIWYNNCNNTRAELIFIIRMCPFCHFCQNCIQLKANRKNTTRKEQRFYSHNYWLMRFNNFLCVRVSVLSSVLRCTSFMYVTVSGW